MGLSSQIPNIISTGPDICATKNPLSNTPSLDRGLRKSIRLSCGARPSLPEEAAKAAETATATATAAAATATETASTSPAAEATAALYQHCIVWARLLVGRLDLFSLEFAELKMLDILFEIPHARAPPIQETDTPCAAEVMTSIFRALYSSMKYGWMTYRRHAMHQRPNSKIRLCDRYALVPLEP